MMTDDERKVLEWLANGDAGISSESIAFEYLGIEYKNCHPPRDPSDLGRCLRLIQKVPEVRNCVDTLATKNERWAKAAKVWDVIADSMAEEVGIDWSKGMNAIRTYNLMKDAGL